MKPIIEIKNLSVDFILNKGTLRACDNVSFTINRGEIVGIIGESGSGKSTMASGILNLVQSPGKIATGEVYYHGTNGERVNLLELTPTEFNKYRWAKIATVFQAAQNALNPVLKIKEHFIETVFAHDSEATKEQVIEKAKKVLTYVRLDTSALEYYPHQLSGGMKQRVLIALSLILDPEVIILDEPTTALDVITQWYIIDILKRIHKELGITLVFLTHDIAVISKVIDRIAVMYAGQLVEVGPVKDVFNNPSHPYTEGLLNAIPSLRDDVTTRKAIKGNPPNLLKLPELCRFAPRCYHYDEGRCKGSKEKTNTLYNINNAKCTRCYKYVEEEKLIAK